MRVEFAIALFMVLVIAVSITFVNGKRSITELEKFDSAVSKIIEEWLLSRESEVK